MRQIRSRFTFTLPAVIADRLRAIPLGERSRVVARALAAYFGVRLEEW